MCEFPQRTSELPSPRFDPALVFHPAPEEQTVSYIEQTLWPPATAMRAAKEGRIFQLDAARRTDPRIGLAHAVALGVVAGLGYLIPFRIMMRLLSEHPQLTLSGTGGIAIYCALVGGTAGLLYAARQRGWRLRARILPAAWCVLLLAVFFIFATPFPLVAGCLLLASMKTNWRPAIRWLFVGLAAAMMLATFAVVLILTPAEWGLGSDLAGFAMILPLTAVHGIPLGLAVTPLRATERRADATSRAAFDAATVAV